MFQKDLYLASQEIRTNFVTVRGVNEVIRIQQMYSKLQITVKSIPLHHGFKKMLPFYLSSR